MVPRRAGMAGSQMFAPLNSGLESYIEEKKRRNDPGVAGGVRPRRSPFAILVLDSVLLRG